MNGWHADDADKADDRRLFAVGAGLPAEIHIAYHFIRAGEPRSYGGRKKILCLSRRICNLPYSRRRFAIPQTKLELLAIMDWEILHQSFVEGNTLLYN